MYGAGHGGFEAFVILTVAMISNLSLMLLINSGGLEAALETLDTHTATLYRDGAQTLIHTSSFDFLLSAAERVFAVATHLALSVLVWTAAVRRGSIGYYFLAILLHLLMDSGVLLMQTCIGNIVLTEGAICVLTAVYVLIAVAVWNKKGFGAKAADAPD
ncbi:MAG: YhfC family intramembrane metalloprotease [Oscillospiraceae bacterium]|nr:YhfC family intramembrane metalloprotease [Oscillospiraceae bacterium]